MTKQFAKGFFALVETANVRRYASMVLVLLCITMMLFISYQPFFARGEETSPGTHRQEGFFNVAVSLFQAPRKDSEVLQKIPPLTPLSILITEDSIGKYYGRVQYKGQEGYVRLQDLRPLPRVMEDYRAGKIMFALDSRPLRKQSLHNAEVVGRMPAETPFKVLGRTQYMLQISLADETYYVYGNDLQELTTDSPLTPALVYSTREQPLLALPLSGAQVLGTMKAGQMIRVLAENRHYLRVGLGEMEGYVPKNQTGTIGVTKGETLLVHAAVKTPLFISATDTSLPEGTMVPGSLHKVSSQEGDFFLLDDSGLYVNAEAVQAILLKAFAAPRLGSVEAVTPLSLYPDSEESSVGALEAGHLYTFTAAAGNWWFVDDGMVTGFVNSRDLAILPQRGETMNPTWAHALGSEVYLPGSSQPQALAQGSLLKLNQQWGDGWFRTDEGTYIHSSQVAIFASVAPVKPHTVPATSGLHLRSLPDETLGENLLSLEEGEVLEVLGFSRYFLQVRARGVEGFVPGKTLKTHETRFLPDSDPPAYGILVNLSTFQVSVYHLDDNAHRVGEPVVSGIAALGKRSTPTLPGKYVLGYKQRWVRFPNTFAAHGITFLRGRYLHGLPSAQKDEATVMDWALEELGTFSSGGCVRMNFDLAAFIYFNCPSYKTVMEVVNAAE